MEQVKQILMTQLEKLRNSNCNEIDIARETCKIAELLIRIDEHERFLDKAYLIEY